MTEVSLARVRLVIDEVVKSQDQDSMLDWVREHTGPASQEQGWVLCLNDDLMIHTLICIAQGSSHRLSVDLPVLLRSVLVSGCDRFVFIHNHPGSTAVPSVEDIMLTEQVAKAASTCGLVLEDHIIVTPLQDVWFSFEQAGLYEPA